MAFTRGRRALLKVAAGTAAGLAWEGGNRVLASSTPAPARPRNPNVYDQAVVIDGLAFLQFDPLSDKPVGEELLRQIRDSGVTAINYTLSAPTFETTVRAIAKWTAFIEGHQDRLTRVRTSADIERAKTEGRLAVLIGFQDPACLGNDLSRLELFHQLGVLIVQLTENTQNLLGSGCNEARDAGLSRFGREVVRRMNDLGMVVDASHCGPQTTLDAIAASRRPIAITHSNCAAVYPTPRAKSDDVIRAMGERGGVMGITLLNFFVGPKPRNGLEDVIAHIDHVRGIAGIDHVGIGSDLPIGTFLEVYPDETTFMAALGPYIAASGATYIHWPATIEGLDGPHKLRTLAEGLADHGYSSSEIVKVLGGNFLRVVRDSTG